MSAFNYTLIRSTRKTLSLIVKDGSLTVRAPHNCSTNYIAQFIQRKQRWIKAKLNQSTRQPQNQYPPNSIYLLGANLTIFKTPTKSRIQIISTPEVNHSLAPLTVPSYLVQSAKQDTALAIAQWLGDLANQFLAQRLKHWSTIMQLVPKKFSLSQATRRWGSCSSQGNIKLNWRLIELPIELIDLVCVHELAHLQHLNHSPIFWQLVAQYMPNYRELKKPLAKYCLGNNWFNCVRLDN